MALEADSLETSVPWEQEDDLGLWLLYQMLQASGRAHEYESIVDYTEVENGLPNDPRLHQPMMVSPEGNIGARLRYSHFADDDFQHIPEGEHSFLLQQSWKAARLGIRSRNSTASHQGPGGE